MKKLLQLSRDYTGIEDIHKFNKEIQQYKCKCGRTFGMFVFHKYNSEGNKVFKCPCSYEIEEQRWIFPGRLHILLRGE